MSTNHTPNYGLSQWERTDKIQMDDFNADNAKIDAELENHSGRVAALEQQVPLLGNCRIALDTYVGTGAVENKHSISFTEKPALILIFGENGTFAAAAADRNGLYSGSSGTVPIGMKWTDSQLSILISAELLQMNVLGMTYLTVMFLPPKS